MTAYKIEISDDFTLSHLEKGIFIVISEIKKIPPHVGMIIDGHFSSLTVKGSEINISIGVFFKNIQLRKIPTLIIKISHHPVFSDSFLNELFVSCVTENKRVEAGGPTCLSPVKSFFNEAFHVSTENIEFVFDLVPLLEKNGLITGSAIYFFEKKKAQNYFTFSTYTKKEINSQIEKVRLDFK